MATELLHCRACEAVQVEDTGKGVAISIETVLDVMIAHRPVVDIGIVLKRGYVGRAQHLGEIALSLIAALECYVSRVVLGIFNGEDEVDPLAYIQASV